jgi:hypothetical protein
VRALALDRSCVLGLAILVAACASPATTTDGAAVPEAVAPRFAVGGPDAEVYRAGAGYPKGARATFFEVPTLVGSNSHIDEIFEGRLIHKAPTPSRLVRVVEPSILWTFEGR